MSKDRRKEKNDQVLELRDLDGSTWWAAFLIAIGLAAVLFGTSILLKNFETVNDQRDELLDRLEKNPAPKSSESELPKT